MSDNQFPYNMQGHEALVRLINDTYPHYQMRPRTTVFGKPFFAPMEGIPGRTFIEAEATERNAFFWFVYRRLDLGVTFRDTPVIYIEGEITPRKIALELNRSYGMNFTERDVAFLDTPLVPLGMSTFYRLRALPGSYVWFGEAVIDVLPLGIPTDARLLESGAVRLMESGAFRLMEPDYAGS